MKYEWVEKNFSLLMSNHKHNAPYSVTKIIVLAQLYLTHVTYYLSQKYTYLSNIICIKPVVFHIQQCHNNQPFWLHTCYIIQQVFIHTCVIQQIVCIFCFDFHLLYVLIMPQKLYWLLHTRAKISRKLTYHCSFYCPLHVLCTDITI